MGIATVVLALMLGRVKITPASYSLFMQSVQVTLLTFAGLCLVGVFLSLARGRLHAGPQPVTVSRGTENRHGL
jgi:hypothetical protein